MRLIQETYPLKAQVEKDMTRVTNMASNAKRDLKLVNNVIDQVNERIDKLDTIFITDTRFKVESKALAKKADINFLSQKMDKCADQSATQTQFTDIERVITKINKDLKAEYLNRQMFDRYMENINQRIEKTCVTQTEFRKLSSYAADKIDQLEEKDFQVR